MGKAGGKLGGLRLPPIVNQTMNTASNSATSASRSIHVIAMLSSVAALCALLGSCATAPGPAPLVGSRGAAPATEPSSVLFQAVSFSALPGWGNDTSSAALPPFAGRLAQLETGLHDALESMGLARSPWRPVGLTGAYDPAKT